MNLEQHDQPVLAAGEAWPAEGWTVLGVSPSLIYPLPDEAWLRAHTVDELNAFLNDRETGIQMMAGDPHRYGYEPFAWRILDAFCGFPWIDPTPQAVALAPTAEERAALEAKQAWAREVRRLLLRQENPIKILYLFGGNRAGKSEWAASRVVKVLMARPGSTAWCFHQDIDMSRAYQQKVVHKYLPSELKQEKGIRKGVTYVAYKQQTGFSEEKFVMPQLEGSTRGGSECEFRFYTQEFKKIQGGEIDVGWLDELSPASWVKEMKARVATRSGWLFVTFTPIEGYTPTVKAALDVAQTTLETTAFVLPKDGGDPDLARALAGEDLEARLEELRAGGADSTAPRRRAQPEVPAGREFERVPRAMRMPDGKGAIFFLHSFDNPMGNPKELWELHASDGTDYKRMKFYGLATKAVAQQFAFNPLVHTFKPAAAVPGAVEEIEERYMDSRYGNSPTTTREGDTTLLEECDKAGLHFVPAPGGRTNERKTHWIELVNDLLHWDEAQPLGPLNEPRLRVSEECANIIFGLQNWTGEDGLDGACMDPVVLLKYLVLADPEDWSEDGSGTLYQFVDPCSGRNWFMCWVRVDRAPSGKRYWIYREWPCPGKYVPGVGDMGVWAEPGDKHDGVRGPAQNPRRWGIQRYKGETMRLEGHADWETRGEDSAPIDGPGEDFYFDDADRQYSRQRRAIFAAKPKRKPGTLSKS